MSSDKSSDKTKTEDTVRVRCHVCNKYSEVKLKGTEPTLFKCDYCDNSKTDDGVLP